jgi:hypothetical protein
MRMFCLLALASIAQLAAGPSWAQQREARLLRGPMTERPVIQAACDTGKWNQCLHNGYAACAQKAPADKRECDGGVYYNCTQQVKGCD